MEDEAQPALPQLVPEHPLNRIIDRLAGLATGISELERINARELARQLREHGAGCKQIAEQGEGCSQTGKWTLMIWPRRHQVQQAGDVVALGTNGDSAEKPRFACLIPGSTRE